MAYDHEEQEQLAAIKAWWTQYGNLVTWLLIVVLLGFAGWNYWSHKQQDKVTQAASLYDVMQTAVAAKDTAKAQRTAADIRKDYSSTVYAQISALTAAKVAVDANDLKSAKEQLQWIIANGLNEEYKAIAKVRLAGILLDEKSFDEALKQLSGEFPAQFDPMVADRKGDILVAQNKLGEARAMYQTALDKTDQKNPSRQLIQIKLDAIGGAPAKAAA